MAIFAGDLTARHVAWAACVLVATLLAQYIRQGYRNRCLFRDLKKQGIPIMKHSMWFGHLETIGKLVQDIPSDAHGNYMPNQILKNWQTLFPDCKQRPPVAYLDLWPFSPPMIVPLLLPVAVQFTQEKSLMKPPEQKNVMRPLTRNLDLSSMEGAEWKVWRKRFNPGFSEKTLTARTPELLEDAENYAARLQARAGPDGSWGPVFALEPETTALAMDIIFRFFFGARINKMLTNKKQQLETAVKDTITRMRFTPHLGNFLGFYNPWRYIKTWTNYRTMVNGLAPVMLQRMNELDQTKKSANSTLVDACIEGFREDRRNGEPNTSDRDFIGMAVGQIGVFIFAGHDTTASSLCWVMLMLSQHPEALARMRAEHDAVLGPDPTKAASLLKDNPQLINSLTYTNALIKEVNRIHANLGTMRGGAPGYYLNGPAGSGYEGMRFPTEAFLVWDNIYLLQRDEDLWERPLEFIPERWLVIDENDPLHPPRNGYRFFELGPRNCIGQNLAISEIKMAIVLVARTLDWECAWDEWDKKMNTKGKKPTLWGERCYQVGTDSPPHVKDGMPIHVKLRKLD
ncbi:cytochrome P450 [Podospora didyma]|uniref:Cytochrome P450 n=1 Tax=Podospora didyma TaxID=330526 RepID=A0AAE0U0U4_9PEZI|nr:cytochrome P450 [Podospora didyma]